MNPLTHLLASWTMAAQVVDEARDRNLVAWAGVLPDLDGAGALVDAGARLLGRPSPWYYGLWHHNLLHGLFGALVIPAALAIGARRKAAVFTFGIVAVHLHLACDLVGSRGPDPSDIWPIPYLAPFSEAVTFAWTHQWPVNGWPNIAFTIALIAAVLAIGVMRGFTPVSMFSNAADRQVVEALRARWARVRPRREMR